MCQRMCHVKREKGLLVAAGIIAIHQCRHAFEKIGIDLLGPFPETNFGKEI